MLADVVHAMTLVAVLVALAVLTNVTTAQRIRHVARLFEERAGRR
jgi:hypothetical protein